MPKTIYFVAGEASADNHGAAVMKSLRKLDVDLRFLGRGGPQMKAIAGEPFANWIDEAGVVGLWEVIKRYAYFRQQFAETLGEIAESKPDAVVLIDYPGFNLRLARALHRRRAATKIIYYISPQVWAWNRGRIKQMARSINLMLCIFPFEADLYNESGLRTIFVGHPMIDRLPARKTASRTDSSSGEIDIERDPHLIGLFPGSRRREVIKNFPIMLDAARELFRENQTLKFEVAAASESLAGDIARILKRARPREGLFRVVTGEAGATMQRAFVGIVASGSATLEAAYFRLPFVLVYKVSWLTYLAARVVLKVKYLGMPNVLAGQEVAQEFIQHQARPHAVAKAVLRLKNEPAARAAMVLEFDRIIAKLGGGGASEKAAQAIIEAMDAR